MTGQLRTLLLLNSTRTILFSRHKTLTSTSNPSFLVHLLGNSSARSFSGRVPRSRDNGRSGIRAGRAGAGGGQGRSLIDDEAELSDWVSDLKTDSVRFKLSDSDEEGPGRDRKRSGMRNDRDLSDRSSRGSLSKRQFDGGDFGERDRRSSRGLNGAKRTPSSSGGFSERKPRGSSLSSRRFASDLEDEDEEEKGEILYRQKRVGHGSSSSFTKRGGRNAEHPESSYKQHRKSIRDTSEDDEEEEEEEDDEDDDVLYGSDDDFFGDKGDKKKVRAKDSFLKGASSSYVESEKPVSRSSDGDKDSYLSNTR